MLMPRNIGVYRAGHFLNFPGRNVLWVFNPGGGLEKYFILCLELVLN